MTVQQRSRKERALNLLQKQLKSGKKTDKKSAKKVELTDKDKFRIETEIKSLQSKLN